MKNPRRTRASIFIIFLIHGLIFSSWVSRIPAVQEKLSLSTGSLGAILMSLSAGSLIATTFAGRITDRYGSRRICIGSTLAMCAALSFVGFAPSIPFFVGALLIMGTCGACMNISMNTQAVAVENAWGSPIMSGFHAAFSIGGMIGSFLGGAFASARIPLPIHLGSGAVLFALFSLPLFSALVGKQEDAAHDDLTKPRFSPVVIALGVLAFCVLTGEGAMADWSAVYLHQEAGAGEGVAAFGYAIFSGTMAIGRFFGDKLTSILGRVRLVRTGGLLAAAGLALALLAGDVRSGLAGFALVGAGLSVAVPLVYGAAGRIPGIPPGSGLAAISGAGYIGFLSGPPLIGFVAEFITLRGALFIICALGLAAAGLARFVEPASTR